VGSDLLILRVGRVELSVYLKRLFETMLSLNYNKVTDLANLEISKFLNSNKM
jgi:hypothetical protein